MWGVLGDKFTTFVLELFKSRSLPYVINTTLVTLITKVEEVVEISHFRSISLTRDIYKVISNILVDTLK